MNNKFSNFDKYSNRISFFFNDKEKVGTYFGSFLTILYILFSIIIFFIYLFLNYNSDNIEVFQYTKDSKNSQNINLNLISFIFGLSDYLGGEIIADETIFYPKIYFYELNKNNETDGIITKKELEYEVCSNENQNKNIFTPEQLNNSYCLKDNYNNLSLLGGEGDKMAFLNIKLYPCENNTQNNNHCKPQEIINSYLEGGDFSLFLKDIVLDQTNDSFHIIDNIKKIYSSIDKQLHKKIVLNFGTTEVKENKGFKFHTKKYVQFSDKEEYFYIQEQDFNKEFISVDFRVSNKISVITIKNTKIIEIFSILGGYMHILNALFSLLSNFSRELIPDLKILNGIFNFNLKQKKMTLRIHTIKDFNSLVFKKSLFVPDKHSPDLNTKIPSNSNISKNSLIGMVDNNNDNVTSQINILNNRKHNSLVIIKESPNENENSKKNYNDEKPSLFSNKKLQYNNKNNNPNLNKKYIYRVGSFYPKLIENEKKSNTNSNILKEYTDQLKFNLFEYYCIKFCSSKNRKNIELFKLGLSLYKKRMDIINVFTLLFFSEKNCLQTDEFYY